MQRPECERSNRLEYTLIRQATNCIKYLEFRSDGLRSCVDLAGDNGRIPLSQWFGNHRRALTSLLWRWHLLAVGDGGPYR